MKRKLKKLPDYRYLGCPITKNNSPWCFRDCVPKNGIGTCGRIAPHGMRSRIQIGIDMYRKSQKSA